MYNLDPINQQARPNTVYVEGLSAAARIAPEQGRLLGLRAGQVINGIIAQRPEGNVLLFDNKALPLPSNMGAVGERLGLQVLMLGGNLIARRLTESKSQQCPAPANAGESGCREVKSLKRWTSANCSWRVFLVRTLCKLWRNSPR